MVTNGIKHDSVTMEKKRVKMYLILQLCSVSRRIEVLSKEVSVPKSKAVKKSKELMFTHLNASSPHPKPLQYRCHDV